MSETTEYIMPAVALRGVTILPDMVMHFDISREKSVKAVEAAMLKDERIFLVTQRSVRVEDPTLDDLFRIGTIAIVKQVIRLPKGLLRVLAEGIERAELLDFDTADGLIRARIEVCQADETPMEAAREAAMTDQLKELFSAYAQEGKKISHDLQLQIMDITELRKLADQIAINLPVNYTERQRLLNAVDLEERYFVLSGMMANEVEAMKIRSELQIRVKERIDENQKEYILREQLKEIREELGDDDIQSDIRRFREETETLKASKEIKDKLFSEIRRFENIVGNPSESGVIRGYIETLLALPWDKMSRDSRDLKKARHILEEDHYGLDKVKERILEYLAVRLITKKGDAPILCLVGPPGTGKTSISKSIARALGRTHVRISLGGVRDEAEIRGHRRTYIGAMPGRIAAGLTKAKVKNPLMLLDEVDKTGSDHRGDIASALLEVLDPEENDKFSDHYVELPIDLSEVLFVATANDISAIPRPLLDRMEVIEISSYTDNEKMHIAREHLIPRQIKVNGLKKGQLEITDEALKLVLDGYTREAGVRSLERQIGQICRKTALKCSEEGIKSLTATAENMEDFLGRRRFAEEQAGEKPEVGIVRGLAWTSVGGVTLETEVNVMPGKGSLQLTGQLGDVMKESAQTAVSFIRSQAKKWQIEEGFFEKHDIHVHIPEGAVPKDGPSAGITMASAILSAITGIPARCDVAMTGEITLRGRVLPIGGLKEKLLAAKKARMKTVLVPEKNRPDVQEMDSEITEGLEIVFVSSMEEVLARILVKNEDEKK